MGSEESLASSCHKMGTGRGHNYDQENDIGLCCCEYLNADGERYSLRALDRCDPCMKSLSATICLNMWHPLPTVFEMKVRPWLSGLTFLLFAVTVKQLTKQLTDFLLGKDFWWDFSQALKIGMIYFLRTPV